MELLKEIIDLGFEIDNTPLLSDTFQFVPIKDIGSYVDYSYVIKYNRIPSRASLTFKVDDFINILKVLKEHNFKLVSVAASFGRRDEFGYVFINDNRIMIDVGNTVGSRSVSLAIDHDDNELTTTKHRTDNINIYFDVACDYTLVDKLRESFSFVEELDTK